MDVYRNTDAGSRNHCCCAKALLHSSVFVIGWVRARVCVRACACVGVGSWALACACSHAVQPCLTSMKCTCPVVLVASVFHSMPQPFARCAVLKVSHVQSVAFILISGSTDLRIKKFCPSNLKGFEPGGRAVYGVGLQAIGCWHGGFESRWVHETSNALFVVSCAGSCLCDELITRPEESYRMCVSVCNLETSTAGLPMPDLSCTATEKKMNKYIKPTSLITKLYLIPSSSILNGKTHRDGR
jgi:hypothetical protein